MDVENAKSWATQPDVCRCCLSTSGHRDLTASYITMGVKEVYSDMLQECFDITVSHLAAWGGQSRMICEVCVTRLRDASGFRRQVTDAERHFADVHRHNLQHLPMETDVKSEDMKDDYGAGNHSCDDFAAPDVDDDEEIHSPVKTETSDNFEPVTRRKSKALTSRGVIRNETVKAKRKKNIKTKNKHKTKGFDIPLTENVCPKEEYSDSSDEPISRISKRACLKNTDTLDATFEVPVKIPEELSVLISNLPDEVQEKLPPKKRKKIAAQKGTVKNVSSRKMHRILSLAVNDDSCLKYTLEPRTEDSLLVENSALRTNIALILQNSTACPFRSLRGQFTCFYCNTRYLHFQELRSHTISNHSPRYSTIHKSIKKPRSLVKADISELKCRLCDEGIDSIKVLTEHLSDIHGKAFNSATKLKPADSIISFNLGLEKFSCHVCGQEFRFFKNLSMHMNDHSVNFVCDVCGKGFLVEHRLKTHALIHEKRQFRCKHCDKDFPSVSVRNYHIRCAHTGATFKCSECSEEFGQYLHRLKHLVKVHNLKKPEFRCEVCQKEFASVGGMRAHMRYTHQKGMASTFNCEECGRAFTAKSTLKKHMVVHTGERNFECNVCHKKYGRANTLREHMRIHLNDRRFTCSTCGQTFVQKCSLKNHLRVHHPAVDMQLLD